MPLSEEDRQRIEEEEWRRVEAQIRGEAEARRLLEEGVKANTEQSVNKGEGKSRTPLPLHRFRSLSLFIGVPVLVIAAIVVAVVLQNGGRIPIGFFAPPPSCIGHCYDSSSTSIPTSSTNTPPREKRVEYTIGMSMDQFFENIERKMPCKFKTTDPDEESGETSTKCPLLSEGVIGVVADPQGTVRGTLFIWSVDFTDNFPQQEYFISVCSGLNEDESQKVLMDLIAEGQGATYRNVHVIHENTIVNATLHLGLGFIKCAHKDDPSPPFGREMKPDESRAQSAAPPMAANYDIGISVAAFVGQMQRWAVCNDDGDKVLCITGKQPHLFIPIFRDQRGMVARAGFLTEMPLVRHQWPKAAEQYTFSQLRLFMDLCAGTSEHDTLSAIKELFADEWMIPISPYPRSIIRGNIRFSVLFVTGKALTTGAVSCAHKDDPLPWEGLI